MQQKLQKWFAASLLTLGCAGALQAQTISTFDDLTLPGVDTDFITAQPAAGDYSFQSGHVMFFGSKESWGGYDHFNYTNYVDTTNPSYTNDRAAITGKGYNISSNYGVAYLDQDYPAHPTQSLITGAKLKDAAVGSKVIGTYVTNTTYAYLYMRDNFTTGDSMTLVIRGYLNTTQSADSVVFKLAKYTATDTILVKDWQWVNLLPLGNVDSLSFQIFSSDDFAPYYFAFDNLTTLDGVCPQTTNITATNIAQNSATINWTGGIANLTTNYQIAVDQSATLAPTATETTTAQLTYAAAGLNASTQYYVHVRAACTDSSFGAWDTLSFKTLQGTGIANTGKNELNLVISPNPAQNYLDLNINIPVTATIYNIEGKLLKTVENARRIDITDLSAGVYILHASSPGDLKSSTLRFVKNH
jgi:hypothetical protein